MAAALSLCSCGRGPSKSWNFEQCHVACILGNPAFLMDLEHLYWSLSELQDVVFQRKMGDGERGAYREREREKERDVMHAYVY